MAKNKIVFLPAFPAGHMSSMLEFAKRLLQASPDSLAITVLIATTQLRPLSSTATATIQSLAASGLDISFHELPPVDPPANADGPEDFLSLFLQSYNPHLKQAISSSSPPVSALFIDFFATAAFDVANELNVPTYVYYASNALMLGLTLHLPSLEARIEGEFEEVEGGIELPGIEAIPSGSMPAPLTSKKSGNYRWFVYQGSRFREARGIVVNTLQELESRALGVLAEGLFVPPGHRTPPVYPVGPVLCLDDDGNIKGPTRRHECIRWLDEQPPASVVFLCFGSNGCFNDAQAKEMAAGLEQSGHRFLWILRSPPTGGVRPPADANLSEALPDGFLDRTRGRGLVWPSWAPQTRILSHRSVGGFVTHCGWNSCLESLWCGVPMLAWPLYAEQHLNAVEMVRDLGIAVGLEVDRRNGNFVTAEELERGVRGLMGESEEGRRVRAKVAEMKVASRKAVEKGGSSYDNLERLVRELVG